jgi:hypothetical protein
VGAAAGFVWTRKGYRIPGKDGEGLKNMGRLNVLLLVTLAVAAPGLPQAAAPTGAASVPNLSGVWAHASITGYEPMASGPTSIINLRRRGITSDNRMLVGDYHNPILKPEAAEIVKKHGELSLAGIGYPTPRNQCWPGGIPFVFTTTAIQVLQQPNEITFLYYEDHEARHVRMNGTHPARVTPSWYGDSIGRFEGDTLVIDTVGIKVGPYAMLDWYGTPHTNALHVIERYRLVDYEHAKDGLERDAKENFQVQQDTIDPKYRGTHLQLEFTVEDAGVFTAPWKATMTYRPQVVPWEESICAENPKKYGTEKDVAVPVADKPDF